MKKEGGEEREKGDQFCASRQQNFFVNQGTLQKNMAGEIASTGMNVHTSLQEGKTLPLKAHGSPPEMTRDRATEHWSGPRISEQVWVAC